MFHDFSIDKIIKFSLASLLLFASVILTTPLVSDEHFLSRNFLRAKMAVENVTYTIAFNSNDEKNAFAAIVSDVLSGQDQAISAEANGKMASAVPALVYHGILDHPDGDNILIEDFKSHMFTLKKAGWQTIGIRDFYLFMDGKKSLPDKSFLLTFDDGRKDSYYPVDPILKTLGYSAVMFVITEHSLDPEDQESPFHLNESELKEMQKTGRWELEAHTRMGHDFYPVDPAGTLGHFYSNKLWLQDQGRLETTEEFKNRILVDFIGAKEDIKERLGREPISFAFPFGDFGQDSINFPQSETIILDMISSIYPLPFYQVWPRRGYSFNYPEKDQILMKRIDVKSFWNADNLLTILDTAREKKLPYFDDFSQYNGWLKIDGRLSINNKAMILESHFTNGSSAYLEGSYLWRDYFFQGNVTLGKGKTFSLLSQYKDDDNHIACEFTPTFMRIKQVNGGNIQTILDKEAHFLNMGETHTVGIMKSNDTVACFLDNQLILQSKLLNMPDHGGVAFETWDPELDNSKITVKNVSIKPLR